MIRIVIPLLAIVFWGQLGYTQTARLKRANKLFEEFNFVQAIPIYEELIKEGKDTDMALRKLAAAYINIHDYGNAEKYYKEIVQNESFEATQTEIMNYALALKSNEKYEEARKWYAKYLEDHAKEDRRAEIHKSTPKDFIKGLMDMEQQYHVRLATFNSSNADFGPSFYNDKLFFASARVGEAQSLKYRHNWNGQPFLDIYVYDSADSENRIKHPVFLKKKVNTKYHEGPGCIDQKGEYFYFTRNNYTDKKLEKSDKDEVNLKIYIVRFDGNEWTEEVEFPFNSGEYSVGHPTISQDGKTLYFTSDMTGGLGGTDIYKSVKEGNEWTKPENLGEPINTEGDEMFPFIASDGTIYFASDGHAGLGGLDNFSAKKTTNGFLSPQNMGYPINTKSDDFGLITRDVEGQLEGYFSSDRAGGVGSDDIYYWKLMIPPLQVCGVAKDKLSGALLDSVQVCLKDNEGKEMSKVYTDASARYCFKVERDKTYGLTGEKPTYFNDQATVSTKVPENINEVEMNLLLEKDPKLALYCLITNNETGQPLEGVHLKILDNITGNELIDFKTPNTGDYKKPLPEKKLGDRLSYNISIEKEGYLGKTITFNYDIKSPGVINVHEKMDMSLYKVDVGTDIGKIIDIQPIYFDYNKFDIRPDAAIELDKIVKVMKENPTIVIELGSHTDCRGSKGYNERLSDKRAKSSAHYIQQHIDDPKRIYGKGYGENKIINGCECEGNIKSDCSEEQHQDNRRTEFTIVKM